MDDEILRALASGLELPRPSQQELYPIAPGKSWGTIYFQIKDVSTKPLLFGHLKRLPADFDVRMVALACSDWSDEYQKLDVLRVVVNGDTFVWAEDDPYFESGKIEIVGNTATVKAIGSQICEDPGIREMPAIKEIFPPRAEWPSWIEAEFGRGRLDLGRLRETLSGLNRVQTSIYVPIENFRDEELSRLFAVINGDTFLQADLSGYQLFGPKLNVNLIAGELGKGQQFRGEVFDWINLDTEGTPTRINPVGPVGLE